ncbi:hypothetical protein EON65_52375 [archaeon]|nr:MAG: hypothetical protein EON65_52375 [archaeon]
MSGIQWLTRNWKNRTASFYEDALYMARAYNNEPMVKMLEVGFANTQSLFPVHAGAQSDQQVKMRRLVNYVDDMMAKTEYPYK